MPQHNVFPSICSPLYNNHVKFILAYRAILHIQPATGDRISFTSPLEAGHYLNTAQIMVMDQEESSPLADPPPLGDLHYLHRINRALRSLLTSMFALALQMNAS